MKLPTVKSKTIALGGGLDLDTPQLSIKDGHVIEALNVEPNLQGGYSKVQGYHATMGGTESYERPWYVIEVDDASAMSVGDTVATNTEAVAITGNKLCVTGENSGTFSVSDTLTGGETVTVASTFEGESDPELFSQYQLASAQYWIGLIDVVPGEGSVLGVWSIGTSIVALRKDVSSETVKAYSSSGEGWTEIPQYSVLKFDTGTISEANFDTIEGAVSSILDNTTNGTGQGVVYAAIKGTVTGSNVIDGYLIVDITVSTFNNNDLIAVTVDGFGWTLGTMDGGSSSVQLDTPSKSYTEVTYSAGTETVVKFDTGAPSEATFATYSALPSNLRQNTPSYAYAEIIDSVATVVTGGNVIEGYFVVRVSAGSFVNNGGIDLVKDGVGSTNVGDVNGSQFQAVINTPENQKFQFISYNFEGAAGNGETMFFCDKVNYAHAWRNGVLVPIFTGMTTDVPTHIEAHKKHLFLSFAGGSLQHSSIGDLYEWAVVTGAAELAVGSKDIKVMESLIDDVMIISTEKIVYGLYGSSSADWSLKILAANTGDYGETLVIADMPILLSQNGITRLDAVQAYGNFASSTLSRLIAKLIESNKTKTIVAAIIVRNKNQYRIYYSDGTGLVMTYDALYGQGQLPQFSEFAYTDNVYCASSVTTEDSIERTYFGGEDGYVYREFSGYSFNGGAIAWSIELPYSHLGSPSVRKGFKGFDVEIDAGVLADISITHSFDYGESYVEAEISADQQITKSLSYKVTPLSGTGVVISTLFSGNSAINQDISINNATYRYLPRRINRG